MYLPSIYVGGKAISPPSTESFTFRKNKICSINILQTVAVPQQTFKHKISIQPIGDWGESNSIIHQIKLQLMLTGLIGTLNQIDQFKKYTIY